MAPRSRAFGPRCVAALAVLLPPQYVREDGGDFIGVVSRTHMRRILKQIDALQDAIRPDAVALCDAFGLSDHHLKSTIGGYDGNVYEAIYEEAKRSPLNGQRMVGWDKLAPQLNIDFIKQYKSEQRWVPTANM